MEEGTEAKAPAFRAPFPGGKGAEQTELSAVEVRFLVRELNAELAGGVVQKVYQYGAGSREFLFEVYVSKGAGSTERPAPGSSGGGKRLLFFGPGKCYLTTEKPPAPTEPPMFAMFLRKHLLGKRIVEVRQRGFDRIVEVVGEEATLIVELLPPGNVVLVDRAGVIVMPLEVQHWKDRDVVAKAAYRGPPSPPDLFAMDFHEFYRALKGSGKGIGALLATGGFGSRYANALCAQVGIEGATPAAELGAAKATELLEAIKAVKPLPVGGMALEQKAAKGEEQAGAAGEGAEPRLSAAYAQLFEQQRERRMEAEQKERAAEAREKAERIMRQQEQAAGRQLQRAEERKAGADALYSAYSAVAAVLGTIERLRASGLAWPALKEKLAALPEGRLVKELREHEGKVVIEAAGQRIELDIRKSVQENAAQLYEAGKQARAKAAGALEAKQRQEAELRALIEKKAIGQLTVAGKAAAPKKKRLRKKWYESFAWFISSDGFLVVAGTSASENERLVKTYAEP
ncbi:MAG TPA: NFACT family protein, partial [archaeon]|nr:NFACT family protein [archaeon]